VSGLEHQTKAPATEIAVIVAPGSKISEIDGWREGALRVRVAAPATQGRANDALVELLARRLGVARSACSILHGHRSRRKLVRIVGLEREAIESRLSIQ